MALRFIMETTAVHYGSFQNGQIVVIQSDAILLPQCICLGIDPLLLHEELGGPHG
jgi:hypothetical protein